MTDFTIVIPHRGNPLGLWATIHSCEEDLRGTTLSYNFVIVSNGEELAEEVNQCLTHLKQSGKLLKHEHNSSPMTPPAARQLGASFADGKYIAFFDNHCLVGKQYFERAHLDMESLPIDCLHSTTIFYTNDQEHFHYKLRLEYNFWAESSRLPRYQHKPYRCAAGGHGGIVVRRSTWEEVGGYGPDSLFDGYGGEELIFDLKLWRYGKQVWIDPKLIHYHFTGARGYTRHYYDNYYVNLLVSANVIGGEKWFYKLCQSFIDKGHLRMHPKHEWWELADIAWQRSAAYAKEVDSKSEKTLDELLVWFRENGVLTK